MNYPIWYENISSRFRDDFAVQLINVLDKAMVAIVAAAYIFAIAFLIASGDLHVIRFVAVPAVTFALVTYIRDRIDAPRPYELYDIDPIIYKDTVGKSFPSRHLSSAVIISCALFWLHGDWGAVGFACCAVVAFTRVVGGVHFPRDVIAACVISAVCGVIGFSLIPPLL